MTERLEVRTYDKHRWADGPWNQEPDRVDFVHAGFACLALRSHLGMWCGYVGVPRGHVYYGVGPEDVPVEAHFGLTYASRCSGEICHVPEPGMPDDVWWLGFDCGHYLDVVPAIDITINDGRATYKDLAYVTAAIRELAEQLRAVPL